jgi:hypothetical protein
MPTNPDIERIKDLLAKAQGGKNHIRENQEAVIKRTLGNLPEFCRTVFGVAGHKSAGKKDPETGERPVSHYWVVPGEGRICTNTGLFFPMQKSRWARNILTIWMLHQGVELDDNFQCRDKATIERSIKSLDRWNDGFEVTEEDSTGYGPEDFAKLKQLVSLAVFSDGRKSFKGTAKQIRKLVEDLAEENGVIVDSPLFNSSRQFIAVLESWRGYNELFTVMLEKYGKVRRFTLESLL